MPKSKSVTKKPTAASIGFTMSPGLEKVAAEHIKKLDPSVAASGLVGGICCNGVAATDRAKGSNPG